MKRIFTFCGALLLTYVILTSCDGANGIEKDAKKVADLQCKAQKLLLKAASGDVSIIAESTKLAGEAATLSKEMETKYTLETDKQKFAEALLKEMQDCR